MVVDALRRQGGVADPVVDAGPPLPAAGARTTLRGVADGEGRFALRRRRSHDLVAVPGCLVAHPLVAEVLREGTFPPGAEVTVRAGAATGERMVVVDGRGGAPVDPDDVDVPAGVRVVTGDELATGRRAWLHEEVAVRPGTARSFFQSARRPPGPWSTLSPRPPGWARATGSPTLRRVGRSHTVGRRARVQLVEARPGAPMPGQPPGPDAGGAQRRRPLAPAAHGRVSPTRTARVWAAPAPERSLPPGPGGWCW